MTSSDPINAIAWENGDAIILARVMTDVLNVATALTQAATSSITRVVNRRSNGAQVGSSSSLVVANTIYDTLQTGSIWSEDTIGFNFKDRIDGATYFEEAEVYIVSYKIVLAASAGTVIVKAVLDAQEVEGF